MPESIIIDKTSEFFITIAKEGAHNFIMLGAMIEDAPKILARVGKICLIDQSLGKSLLQRATMFGKTLFSHAEASLMNEYDIDDEGTSDISYQSYSITYEQYLEFLSITKEIHEEQLENYKQRELPSVDYKDLTYPQKGVYKLREGIHCYMPTREAKWNRVFKYSSIHEFKSEQDKKINPTIIARAKKINIFNTCRTTARDLLNYILHYSLNIPDFFALPLNYKTQLIDGSPPAHTFYILPPPPNCFNLSTAQIKILNILYERLANLPKNQPGSEVTREKFDKLKELYKSIVGEPNISLNDLLDNIVKHRNTCKELFATHRNNNILTKVYQMFFKRKTSTEKAYEKMKSTVEDIIETTKKSK